MINNTAPESTASTPGLFREPGSGFTHLPGVILAIIGTIVLAMGETDSIINAASLIVYGVSLILLYTASTVYHLLPLGDIGVQRLRLLDHLMIYVLIAGTYTPVCMIALPTAWGNGIMAGIWGLAILGMLTQGLWFNAPRWVGTLYYTLMGWLIVIAIVPLIRVLPLEAVGWLVGGGLVYSIGAVIYATKKPAFVSGWLGFHELFHLFILAGSICHFWMIYRYVVPMA